MLLPNFHFARTRADWEIIVFRYTEVRFYCVGIFSLRQFCLIVFFFLRGGGKKNHSTTCCSAAEICTFWIRERHFFLLLTLSLFFIAFVQSVRLPHTDEEEKKGKGGHSTREKASVIFRLLWRFHSLDRFENFTTVRSF